MSNLRFLTQRRFPPGLAQLLRFLRNAGGADLPNPLGPIAIAGGSVAAMADTPSSPRSPAGARGVRKNGGPRETRTPDRQLRRLPLYPTELWGRHVCSVVRPCDPASRF